MPQHRENSGESQQPAPEEPVKQSRVGDVAGETRESVADTVTPLLRAIEDITAAAPDAAFAQRYEELAVELLHPPHEDGMPDALRAMLQHRESFNAALVRLFETVLALHRDPSEEELRSIGTLLRTVGDLRIHDILTPGSRWRIRTLAPQLLAEGRFAFLGTAIRYGTMRYGNPLLMSDSLSSVVACSLDTSWSLSFFERTLAEATMDDERNFRASEGLQDALEHVYAAKGSAKVVATFVLRLMEHEAQEMVKERTANYYSIAERYFPMLLRNKRWSHEIQSAVIQWLEEKGFDTADVMDWWSDSAGWPVEWIPQFQAVPDMEKAKRISPDDCYMRNVRRCLQLEAHNPGSLQELSSSFNLHDVGRYDPETLVAQYEERENVHKPYVLVIFPYDDHNGAFYCDADIIENLRQQLEEKGYLLRIIEGGDDILKTLARLRRDARYPLPAGLILGAHGQPSSMSFSKRHPLSLKTIEKKVKGGWEARKGMEEGMEKLFQKKARQCPIVLISCSTGQPEGVAHVLSRYTEGIVSGPQVPSHVAAIRAQFDENGKLTALVPSYEQGKTGTFMAGEEVPVAEEEQ